MRPQALVGTQGNSLLLLVLGTVRDLSAKPEVNCETWQGKIDFIEGVCLNVEKGF